MAGIRDDHIKGTSNRKEKCDLIQVVLSATINHLTKVGALLKT